MRPRLRTRPFVALLAAYALALQALLMAWGPAAAVALDPATRCNPSTAIGQADGSVPPIHAACGNCVMPGCSAAATLPQAATFGLEAPADAIVNAITEGRATALRRSRASARGPPLA